MSKQSSKELNAELSRLAKQLPDWAGRLVEWLRGPSSAFVRVPLAIVLIFGGFVGFLPILGFWMIPLGLALLAQDVPFLQGPMTRLIRWVADKLEGRKKDAK
jgi:membrane-bound ClpP family serine protease